MVDGCQLPLLDSRLRTTLERRAIRQRDAPSLDVDPALILEVAHRAGNRLAARADHVRDRLVRERLLDLVAVVVRREVEEQAGNAARDVEQRQAVDLAVSATQAARQLLHEHPCDGGVRLDATAEVVATEYQHVRIFHRDDVSRPRLLVDQRQLTEVLARAEDSENHLATVLTDEHDLHATITDDEQGISWVVLEQNDAALRIALLAGQLREALQFHILELREEW